MTEQLIDLTGLSTPFSPAQTHWRVGSLTKKKDKCMPLAYIDARDVMDRLDNVVGPENWQCRYSHASNKTVCEIGIRIRGEWVWKSNGAGDTDIEASKGALSDAFKRAAVLWGVGRYLYGLSTPWVPVNQYKQIEESAYKTLDACLLQFVGRVSKEAAPKRPPITDDTIKDILSVVSPMAAFPTDDIFRSWVEKLKGRAIGALNQDEGAKLLEFLKTTPNHEEWGVSAVDALESVLAEAAQSAAKAPY